MHSENDIWQTTLDYLKLQMPKGTFEQWLRDSVLLEQTDGLYRVAVKDEAAKDWLENRLRAQIKRTLRQVVQGTADVEFVVQTATSLPEPPAVTEAAAANQGHDIGIQYAQQTDFSAMWPKAGGYAPVPHYVSQFWAAYLKAGAFTLWKYLDSTDRRPTKDLTARWTPAKVYRQSRLAKQLGSIGRRVIIGGLVECAAARTCRLISQPRSGCCQGHTPHRFGPRKKDQCQTCYYWRPGALARLYHQQLLAVEIDTPHSGPRNHRMRLQAFRVLPLLTPGQVAHLSDVLQENHQHWLEAHERVLDLSYREWQQITVPSLVSYQPGYEQGRQLYGQPEFNPLARSAREPVLIPDDGGDIVSDELMGIV